MSHVKIIKTNFGTFTFFEEYVISVIDEGVDLNDDLAEKTIALMYDFYGQRKPFGYITHRIHSYSINPLIYLKVSDIPNLVCFAVVSNKMFDTFNINIEKAFNKKPHELFMTLQEAVNWVKLKVANYDRL